MLAALIALAFVALDPIGGAQAAAPNTQVITGAFTDFSGGTVFDRTFPLVLNDGGTARIGSNPDGSGNINVDDFLGVIVTRQDGSQASLLHEFSDPECTTDTPRAPISLAGLALPGNNVVRVVISDNAHCGAPAGAITPLWLAVNGQATTTRATPVVLEALPPSPPLAQVFVPNLNGKVTETGTSNPLAGVAVAMHAGDASGAVICSAITDADGVATCGGVVEDITAVLALGYTAVFSGNAFYAGSEGHAPLIELGGQAILP